MPRFANSCKQLDQRKILVVDDSEDNLVLIKILLGREGALVDTAVNGDKGVDKALKNDYDVVLMDIQMPELDGFEALARLRARQFKKPVNPGELVRTLVENAGRAR